MFANVSKMHMMRKMFIVASPYFFCGSISLDFSMKETVLLLLQTFVDLSTGKRLIWFVFSSNPLNNHLISLHELMFRCIQAFPCMDAFVAFEYLVSDLHNVITIQVQHMHQLMQVDAIVKSIAAFLGERIE